MSAAPVSTPRLLAGQDYDPAVEIGDEDEDGDASRAPGPPTAWAWYLSVPREYSEDQVAEKLATDRYSESPCDTDFLLTHVSTNRR